MTDDERTGRIRERIGAIVRLYGLVVARGRIKAGACAAIETQLAALALAVGLNFHSLLDTAAQSDAREQPPAAIVTESDAFETSSIEASHTETRSTPLIRTVREVANLTVHTRPLPPPFQSIFGSIPYRTTIMLHGVAGGGKSTLAWMLANVIAKQDAQRGGKRVLYVNSEQRSTAGGMTKRIRRARVTAPNIDIIDTKNFGDVYARLDTGRYSLVVIDSVTRMFGTHNTHVEGLLKLADDYPDVTVMFITHEGKGERTYKGGSGLAHDAEVIVSVERGIASTEKNHYGEPGTVRFMQWEPDEKTISPVSRPQN